MSRCRRNFNKLNRIWCDSTRVLPSITEFYRVLPSFTEFFCFFFWVGLRVYSLNGVVESDQDERQQDVDGGRRIVGRLPQVGRRRPKEVSLVDKVFALPVVDVDVGGGGVGVGVGGGVGGRRRRRPLHQEDDDGRQEQEGTVARPPPPAAHSPTEFFFFTEFPFHLSEADPKSCFLLPRVFIQWCSFPLISLPFKFMFPSIPFRWSATKLEFYLFCERPHQVDSMRLFFTGFLPSFSLRLVAFSPQAHSFQQIELHCLVTMRSFQASDLILLEKIELDDSENHQFLCLLQSPSSFLFFLLLDIS